LSDKAHSTETNQFLLDPLLSDREVAKLTGRARSTLQKDRLQGTGIPWVRIGKLVRYRTSTVARHLEALPEHRSTSETEEPVAP
jgi:hypothetical protein